MPLVFPYDFYPGYLFVKRLGVLFVLIVISAGCICAQSGTPSPAQERGDSLKSDSTQSSGKQKIQSGG